MEELVSEHLLLYKLRSGLDGDWKKALGYEGEDDLSRALRIAGWLSAPADDIDLGIAEMRSGLELLIESSSDKEAELETDDFNIDC